MTVRYILSFHMYFCSSLTINASYDEIYLQYVYYNLLAHILFSTSSYVLVSVLYKVQNLQVDGQVPPVMEHRRDHAERKSQLPPVSLGENHKQPH